MYINLYLENKKNGYLSAFIDEHNNDKECVITSLFISEECRNKGFATYLLKTLQKILIKTDILYSKRIITLTDCSDHFGDNDHNIYKKVGFEYDEEGLPEMTWNFRQRKYNYKTKNKNIIIEIL